MLKFLTDENFDNKILRALKRRDPSLDIVRVQDVGLLESSDEDILEWAATTGRLLLTHDVNTIPRHVNDRLTAGLSTLGVVEVSLRHQIGLIVEDILILNLGSYEGEWEGQVIYIPLT
jgi:predicted nuclease of predicted toxin-antitoxin system